MLSVADITTGYGDAPALFGVSVQVDAGQVVALLGRNGMGKTTTVAAIMGLLPCWSGSIAFRGQSITGLPPYRVAQHGLGLAPEGRQIFPTLTVQENLVATAAHRTGHRTLLPPWTLPRVWALFPRLHERRASMGATLSGGEQQMLAIARALMTNPALLILDEATEGLAPAIRATIWAALAALKAEGLAILLIDKNLAAVLRLADRAVIIEKGRTVWTGTAAALHAAPSVSSAYLQI